MPDLPPGVPGAMLWRRLVAWMMWWWTRPVPPPPPPVALPLLPEGMSGEEMGELVWVGLDPRPVEPVPTLPRPESDLPARLRWGLLFPPPPLLLLAKLLALCTVDRVVVSADVSGSWARLPDRLEVWLLLLVILAPPGPVMGPWWWWWLRLSKEGAEVRPEVWELLLLRPAIAFLNVCRIVECLLSGAGS